MARVFISGSTDGLGLLTAKLLIKKGHNVILHARNSERAKEVLKKVPEAETILIGNFVNIEETINLANEANSIGSFNVVIHNAGVYQAESDVVFKVNTLAPYILTCIMHKPERLIYLSSGMHLNGHAKLESLKADISKITYSDSKLQVLMLCKAVARKWKDVYSNAVDPGWVPTKMGGRGATDDLQKGYETQVFLAEGNNIGADVSGKYFYHKEIKINNPEAEKILLQNQFLSICKEITGISFPER